MRQMEGPLSAAHGIALGCLFSGVIWLAGLNMLLLSRHVLY